MNCRVLPSVKLLAELRCAVQVRSLAVDAAGQWLASGSDDGWVRVWEVRSGRSMRAWNLGAKVRCVAWCPTPGLPILAAAAGNRIVLLPAGTSLRPSTGDSGSRNCAALPGAQRPDC